MKSIGEIKQSVAIKYGFKNFKELHWNGDAETNFKAIKECMLEYGRLMSQKQLEMCADYFDDTDIKNKILNILPPPDKN